MQADFTLQRLRDIQDLMFAACDQMLAPYGKQLERPTGIGADVTMPFDIQRPVQHQSKADFQQEYKAVKSSVKDLKRIAKTFMGSDNSPQSLAMVSQLDSY